MSNTRTEAINEFISSPDLILRKKKFTRGIDSSSISRASTVSSLYNESERVSLPRVRYKTVSQEQFMMELDPNCHSVLFDENIPSICRKTRDGGYVEIEYTKMACSWQKNIADKHTLHLCANGLQFTLLESEPSENQTKDFALIKKYWKKRNQEGAKYKMVHTQKTTGDAGLLYYFDYKGRIKSRILKFPDYILLPINDANGDRLAEAVYYRDGDLERIDLWDDTYQYRFTSEYGDQDGWSLESKMIHKFDEIPLITKRGDVAWNNVQSIIETYEIVFNIYNVIQKRQGWGILFIKGRADTKGKEVLNGSVIIKAEGLDAEKTDVSYKTPPTGEGMKQSLELLEQQIKKGSGFTLTLPEDIKAMGDISGTAILYSMSLDNQTALEGTIEWQNVASKMVRLFKQGLAIELVNNGTKPTAITDFEALDIDASFSVWMPRSILEYNNMIIALKQANIISGKTATELCTESKPDEELRTTKEELERQELEAKQIEAASNSTQAKGGEE